MRQTLMSVKEYAKREGVCTSAIYNRIKRRTIKFSSNFGIILVEIDTDKTIKKPRKLS